LFGKNVCLMVFNATFNNISVVSWRSVLLVEETGGPGENHQPVASHWQTLSHNVVHLVLIEVRTHNISDCICSCKSNYHTITATTAPGGYWREFQYLWNFTAECARKLNLKFNLNKSKVMVMDKCIDHNKV